MQINIQSTEEDQGNWVLIRGLSIVESKCKEFFRRPEEGLIASDQLRQQQTRDRASESERKIWGQRQKSIENQQQNTRVIED